MANGKKNGGKKSAARAPESYRHPEADSPLRPDVGTAPEFRKRKPPVKYRYDSSLSPALDWDDNPARAGRGADKGDSGDGFADTG